MKKIVLTFGLISGAISALLMFGTTFFIDQIGFDKGVFVGYTTMVVAFLLVFFGIRSYRENIGNGAISFGRAFSVGILIALVSILCYVISWEILSYTLMKDFLEKYSSYVLEHAKSAGASAAELEVKRQEMQHFATLYKNPLLRAAFTFIEPLPVGLLITLISALILRKKPKNSEGDSLPNVGGRTVAQG